MSTPFLYQLQGATFDTLTAAPFKAAVVDVDDSKLDPTQLQTLENQGKTVFAYLSIGEAESYRSYWADGNWSVTPPSFLLSENPDWAGNFRVKFWDPAWQAIVMARVDAAIALGYDGIYLDVVDGYQQVVVQQAYTGASIRADMIDFVIAISEHAKAINPNFKVIPQNAIALLGLSDQDFSGPNTAYINAIDGVGVEDQFYNDDLLASTDDLPFLKLAIAAHKFVLATSYPTDPAHQAEFVASAIAAGFIPFVADRGLSGVIAPIDDTISELLPASTDKPWSDVVTPPADGPTVAGPLTATGVEDSGVVTVNLLDGATGADGTTLSITNVHGLVAGLTLDGATLSVDTGDAAFQILAAGATRAIEVTYQVSDGAGGLTAQIATVTLTGENDAPVVADVVSGSGVKNSGTFTVNLLTGATDVDGDALVVSDVSTLPPGLSLDGATLSVDTSNPAFQGLAAGASQAIEVTYQVSDGAGGSVAQTATITVNGANTAPVVAAGVTGAGAEDSGVFTVNLLNGATDADNDTLSITDVSALAAGLSLDGATLSVDTGDAAFQSLAAGATQSIEINYNVSDGAGGSTPQTAKITITGVNDAPVVGQAPSGAGAEDTGVFTVNLLAGASDIDGDALVVSDISTLPQGLTLDGTTLSVDTSDAAFQSLAAGVTRTIDVTYNVADGAGGLVAQTASITLTGVNDAAVISGVAAGSVSEEGVLTAAGALSAVDPDTDQSGFVAQNATLAAYGSFSLDAAGAWSYALDNANAAVQVLNTGETLTDTMAVTSIDGTSANVVITINGLNDANPVDGTTYSDNLRGTNDADLIRGFAGNDDISARGGNDIVFGGDGYDKIYGGSGNDELHGGDSRDLLEGDDGNDSMYGDAGRDELNGGDGSDHLYGGADEDDLSGENGNDTLDGGAGDDWLSGGFGSDTFVFKPGAGRDTISDFDSDPRGGQDYLDLTAFNISAAEFQARVAITEYHGDVLVTIDGNPSLSILLEHVRVGSITVDDFILH